MSKRTWIAFIATAVGVVAVDQITKALIRGAMQVGDSFPLIDGVLWCTHVHNTGAAFGMFRGQRLPLILIALAVVLVIGYAVVRLRPTSTWARLALALVMGGAVGNLVDRVVSGGVTDFFDLGWFPVFNVADISLDVGAAILAIWLLFGNHDRLAGACDPPRQEADAEHSA